MPGIQWLLSLGPIVWNFSNLTMQFKYEKQNCMLQGIVPGLLQIVSSNQFVKCLSLIGNGPYPMLLTSEDQTTLTMQSNQLPLDLQDLLANFDDIFQVLTGLPPHQLQDHRIPLMDESQVVKVRPYRYPAV